MQHRLFDLQTDDNLILCGGDPNMAAIVRGFFNRCIASTSRSWSQVSNKEDFLLSCFLVNDVQKREMSRVKRRTTHPPRHWVQRRLKFFEEYITPANKEFIQEFIKEKYSVHNVTSPLKDAPWPRGEWQQNSIRTGVIARKIGIYPMWTKNGQRLLTTLLQVLDNHVIRYIPPEVSVNYKYGDHKYKGKYGLLIVGARSAEPQKFTAAYNGLFAEAGVMPKLKLTKFVITPNAAIQPGTPLSAAHFRVGDYVDVYGKTIGHGFQGVMKRWGMKGGPASHGTTKAHRRVGSIGSGRQMRRVWPGKRMPGHMGQERRILKGLRIWRINTKYNVIWVHGPAVPGHVHHYVYIMDTFLQNKKPTTAPPFPTHYPEDDQDQLPEEIYHPDLHAFSDPTLTFSNEPDIVVPTAKAQKNKR